MTTEMRQTSHDNNITALNLESPQNNFSFELSYGNSDLNQSGVSSNIQNIDNNIRNEKSYVNRNEQLLKESIELQEEFKRIQKNLLDVLKQVKLEENQFQRGSNSNKIHDSSLLNETTSTFSAHQTVKTEPFPDEIDLNTENFANSTIPAITSTTIYHKTEEEEADRNQNNESADDNNLLTENLIEETFSLNNLDHSNDLKTINSNDLLSPHRLVPAHGPISKSSSRETTKVIENNSNDQEIWTEYQKSLEKTEKSNMEQSNSTIDFESDSITEKNINDQSSDTDSDFDQVLEKSKKPKEMSIDDILVQDYFSKPKSPVISNSQSQNLRTHETIPEEPIKEQIEENLTNSTINSTNSMNSDMKNDFDRNFSFGIQDLEKKNAVSNAKNQNDNSQTSNSLTSSISDIESGTWKIDRQIKNYKNPLDDNFDWVLDKDDKNQLNQNESKPVESETPERVEETNNIRKLYNFEIKTDHDDESQAEPNTDSIMDLINQQNNANANNPNFHANVVNNKNFEVRGENDDDGDEPSQSEFNSDLETESDFEPLPGR